MGLINLFYIGAPTIYAGAGFGFGMEYGELSEYNPDTTLFTEDEYQEIADVHDGFISEVSPMVKIGVELRMILAINVELNVGYRLNSRGSYGPTAKALVNFLLLDAG